GYLPTHNPNYRLPQGSDPVWNNANCRNKRLFKDRAVKKVAANTKPFLLQTYRRDMGGGNFVLMKDVSSPIYVRRRRWGAFRIGFPQSCGFDLRSALRCNADGYFSPSRDRRRMLAI